MYKLNNVYTTNIYTFLRGYNGEKGTPQTYTNSRGGNDRIGKLTGYMFNDVCATSIHTMHYNRR